MRLRIVGSSPAMPRPGSACSSYLLRTATAAVLLDAGSGAAGKLQLALRYENLDAIVISHMHPDHFFDLVPFRYGLKYGEASRAEPMPLWLPPGGAGVLTALSRLICGDDDPDFFTAVFALREYDPAHTLTIADLRLSFRRTRHYVAAFSIRGDCGDASIAYSADTAPCESVVEHARDSALFLCEAALGLGTEEGERGHASAREAGEMAARARVKRLVLTHYPATCAIEDLIAEAKRAFSGPVSVAEDGLEIAV